MARLVLRLAVVTALCVFGAIGGAFALFGLGLPYLLATLPISLLAGAVAWGALQMAIARPLAGLGAEPPAALTAQAISQRERLAALEETTASLRHDIRGMLSPGMLVSDRLLTHEDPKIVRSGETIIRAITRATARLAETRAP